MKVKPLVLIILDGWGYREDSKDNAINHANKPNWDRLWNNNPHTLIEASGNAVGLPEGQMGNSEVGHVNIGSGRVVYQELTRIDKAITDGEFSKNKEIVAAVSKAVKNDKAVHIMGLMSSGGVHSHQNHIFAMIKTAQEQGAKRIFVHAFLDGRDVPPKSAASSLKETDNLLNELKVGYVASICGRYYAMDRDKRWDRVELAYDMLTQAKSDYTATNSLEGLDIAYDRGETDEFVKPTVIIPQGKTPVLLEDGDSLFFMNFRADRARELSYALANDDFDGFTRRVRPHINFVNLTQYAADINASVAYKPEKLTNILGEYLADNNLTQLRIAETEKYAHVTFFFNGGKEEPFKGEDRILIPSPKVATYDMQPEMSAGLVTDKLVEAIESEKYDVIICNYANSDMVGHTGLFDAAVKAIETLDNCLGRVIDVVKKVGGEALITADHGNSDLMVDQITGQPHTAHTTNPVPLIYIGREAKVLTEDGKLSDIAPSMLKIIGLGQPKEMSGSAIFTPYN